MAMREPEVEQRLRNYLVENGYDVLVRYERTGPDIIAKKEQRTLLLEVKGDRPGHKSSPGTIHVDVMTLLGQIVMRRGKGEAEEYGIGIRPVHQRLVEQALPTLKELAIKVFLVEEGGIKIIC